MRNPEDHKTTATNADLLLIMRNPNSDLLLFMRRP